MLLTTPYVNSNAKSNTSNTQDNTTLCTSSPGEAPAERVGAEGGDSGAGEPETTPSLLPVQHWPAVVPGASHLP